MKAGTESHMKFKRLQAFLGLPQWQIVGVLESLWLMTTSSAWMGDIGRYTNQDIAILIGWTDDADALIDALVKSGFLDAVDDARRLVVHDWHEHCPTYIQKRIQRRQRETNGQPNGDSGADGGQREPTADNGDQREPLGAPRPINPSHSIPSHSIPSSSQPPTVADTEPPPVANGHQRTDPGEEGEEAVRLRLVRTAKGTTRPPENAGGGEEGIWNSLMATISKLGVSDARATIHAARGAGVSAEYIGRLIAIWRTHPDREAWGSPPATLAWRIRNAIAGTPPEEGWPRGRNEPSNAADGPPSRPPREIFEELASAPNLEAAATTPPPRLYAIVQGRFGKPVREALETLGGVEWLKSIPAIGAAERDAKQREFVAALRKRGES